MMGVFAKNGAWWIDYYVQGRRKRERIGGPLTKALKKVATDVLAKRKVELAEGKFLDKRTVLRCTFHELAELYLEWSRVNHAGHKPTRSRIERLRATFGPKQLRDITPLAIDTYVAERAQACKPATVNREVSTLRHMFQKAIEWGKAAQNPAVTMRPLRANNHRLRYLSLEEIHRLLQAADMVLWPIVLTALHTGLRRGNSLPSPGQTSTRKRRSFAWYIPRMGNAGKFP
jgi:integrase